MLKGKEYKVEDSNIALLGSALEKEVKLAAAKTEKAWAEAGQKIGLQIWRIEKFQVISWPKDKYGQFFDGDSYIVLRTYKKDPNSPALAWDVHFWLGKFTTQDEAGTAAYKTVELDDFLGGAPIQFREVQEHESDTFLKIFNNQITILSGGVDSGFKHVEPEKYKPRLLHLKGQKKVRVTEVEIGSSSLNSGDVFILDAGLKLFQWNGKKAGPMEKQKGASLTRALKEERKGKPEVMVMEEGEKSVDTEEFWKLLGGEGTIKSAEEGGSDQEAEKESSKIRKLFQLSDASGKMEFKLISEGNAIKRSQLIHDDVMIFDAGNEVYAWIGKGASKEEKKQALGFAQDYLTKYNRPGWLPISRVLDGGENETFEAHFR
jgi:gelsolin